MSDLNDASDRVLIGEGFRFYGFAQEPEPDEPDEPEEEAEEPEQEARDTCREFLL